MAEPRIIVNVPVDAAAAAKIERHERFWSGTKLVILALVTLSIALVILYSMAQTTSQTTWDDWLAPY